MRGTEFNDLMAFTAVAKERSFAKAARTQGTTSPVLSVAVRRLEERVGVRLLNRTTRSVGLTEAGAQLLGKLTGVLSGVERAVESLGDFRDTPRGTVRINASQSAATSLLAPRLAAFFERCPDVRVDITVDPSKVDLAAGDFDLGVRLHERLDQDMLALPLGGKRQAYVVASPEYLSRFRAPKNPHDLQRHRCIVRKMSNGALHRWEFERDEKTFHVQPPATLVVDDTPLQLRAALEGVGLTWTIDDSVEPLLESGRLVRVLDRWSPRFRGFFLTWSSRRQHTAAVRALIDFFRELN